MIKNLKIAVNKNIPYAYDVFSQVGKVIALDSKEMNKNNIANVDILIVRSETKVNYNLLDGTNIRFVGTVTSGIDHVDIHYLHKNGIEFASAPGSNSNSVAEYITAALLTIEERLGLTLKNKTIGIVGVGHVGSKVKRIAEIFGMEVLLNDPPLQRKTGNDKFLPLDKLMEADILTLHVPLTRKTSDATYHLFDDLRIKKMKPNSILINTSRGAVVDSKALLNALTNKYLRLAILDVWENEPEIDIDLLDKVFLGTPHIAGYSIDGKVNALQSIYDAVCKFIGVEGSLKVRTLMGAPENPIIRIKKIADGNSTVLSCVKHCYNIEADDEKLRLAKNLPSKEIGLYFKKLRDNYSLRFEFSNYEVRLSQKDNEMKQKLESLGFKCKDKDCSM